MAWRTNARDGNGDPIIPSPDIITSRRVYYENTSEGAAAETYRWAKKHTVETSEYRGYTYEAAIEIAEDLEAQSTGSNLVNISADINQIGAGGYTVISIKDTEESSWTLIKD